MGPLDASKHVKKKSMSSQSVGKREEVNNPEVVTNLEHETLGELDRTEISSQGTTWMRKSDHDARNGEVANAACRGATSGLEISEVDSRQSPSSMRLFSVRASERRPAL
jgi:hypothetical protein